MNDGLKYLLSQNPDYANQIKKLVSQNDPVLTQKVASLGNSLQQIDVQSAYGASNEQKALSHMQMQTQQQRLAYSSKIASRNISGGLAATMSNAFQTQENNQWNSIQNNIGSQQAQNNQNKLTLQSQIAQVLATSS